MKACRTLLAALVTLTGSVGLAPAEAVSLAKLRTLELVLDDPGLPSGSRSLGRLNALVSKSRRRCNVQAYERGATLICSLGDGRRAIIDLVAEPTRAPEFLRVEAIRPDGPQSRPLPRTDLASFLAGLKEGTW